MDISFPGPKTLLMSPQPLVHHQPELGHEDGVGQLFPHVPDVALFDEGENEIGLKLQEELQEEAEVTRSSSCIFPRLKPFFSR